jgi:hypothetical protein
MTTTIARDDLIGFLQATGHTPRIDQVSEGGAIARTGQDLP